MQGMETFVELKMAELDKKVTLLEHEVATLRDAVGKDSRLIGTKEFARVVGVTQDSVRRWIFTGNRLKLPLRRQGHSGRWKCTMAEALEWRDNNFRNVQRWRRRRGLRELNQKPEA